MHERVSVEPFPPAGYIREFMEGRGWTQDDLADVMGRTRQTVNRLLQGRSAVTPETAKELAAAFGTSADVWMNLQAAYELSLAASEDQAIKRRAKIFDKVPVRELQRRRWIPIAETTDELESAVCQFLRISTIDEETAIQATARKSTRYTCDTASQMAWYCRARELAEHTMADTYKNDNLVSGLADLMKLAAHPEDARSIPKLLADLGVRLVLVKHLRGSKVDGVAFWLDKSSPVVALSLRYDRIDNFWFTLMHELSHIRHRHNSGIDVDLLVDTNDELPEIELQANADAAEWLITQERMKSFILRTSPNYSRAEVVRFAQARGVHPGIVVGQLHNKKELGYARFRQLLVKVGPHILPSARSDGWAESQFV